MDWMEWIIIIYLFCINIISIVITIYDKKASKKRGKRIPEKELIFLTVIGGGIGMYITMLAFRHKTKHPKFMVGIPVIVAVEILLLLLLKFYLK